MEHSVDTAVLLEWQGDWRTNLFVGLFLPFFIGLGLWQLDRAEEKRHIASAWQSRQLEQPQALEQVKGGADDVAYRRVVLAGEFLPGRDFLLDNRILRGRYGFDVLSPLRLQESGKLVLVNRGWIGGDPARRSLPTIPVASGRQRLSGTIYVPPGEAYQLGEAPAQTDWPRLLLALDVPVMAAMLEEELYPYSIRLDASSASSLEIDWPVINTSPEKHGAYALQWFAMALALLIMYLLRSSNLVDWLRARREPNHD